jgi:hypothetical protein
METHQKISELSEHAFTQFLQTCSSNSPAWSHLNIMKALKQLKQLKVQPKDARGLTKRAGALLDEASAALQRLQGEQMPNTMLDLGNWKNPTAEMHEILFHPRTAGMMVHSLANLGGHTHLFQKTTSFLLRWLRVAGGGDALEPVDMANIVWAFGTQGSDAIAKDDASLVGLLAAHVEHCLERARPSGALYSESAKGALKVARSAQYSTKNFSNVIWGLAKLSSSNQTPSSSSRAVRPPAWADTLIPQASTFALKNIRSFEPREFSAVVWAFAKLGSTKDCRPFLVDHLLKHHAFKQ